MLSYLKGKIDKALDPKYIISVHSFTRVYEGNSRNTEIGVLTSLTDQLAAPVRLSPSLDY